jgi:hypothetical protein
VVKNVPNVTEAVKILKKMLEGTNS